MGPVSLAEIRDYCQQIDYLFPAYVTEKNDAESEYHQGDPKSGTALTLCNAGSSELLAVLFEF